MMRATMPLAGFAILATGCALGTRPFVITEHAEGLQTKTTSRCVLVDGPVRVFFQDKTLETQSKTQETWTFSVDQCTAARLNSMELQVLANARKPKDSGSWVPLGKVAGPEGGTTSDRELRVSISKDWRDELGTPLVVRYRSKIGSEPTPWAVAQIGTQTPWLSPLILTGAAVVAITALTVGGD